MKTFSDRRWLYSCGLYLYSRPRVSEYSRTRAEEYSRPRAGSEGAQRSTREAWKLPEGPMEVTSCRRERQAWLSCIPAGAS